VLADIDRTLFPDECLVIEIEPGTRFAYPIFKNGSSSLIKADQFKTLSREEINHLSTVDVFVRNPHERFLSGVQTYLKNASPELDRKTLLFMIQRYLYLDRHFCPQLYWLINLSRFTSAKFHLRPMDDLRHVVNTNLNESQHDSDIKEYFRDMPHVKFYNEMDEVLTVNLINQTVSLIDIMEVLRDRYGTLYQDTFGVSKIIANVLSPT